MEKKFIRNIFDYFNNSSINYCVLRNYINLPDDFGNDIDILVKKSDLNFITKSLKIIANSNNIQILKIVNKYGYRGLYFFDQLSNKIILIDLFYRLQKRWNVYVSAENILNNKILYRNIYVISPEYELYSIALKEILTYGLVRSKYQKRFNKLKFDIYKFKKISNELLTRESSKILYNLFLEKKVFNKTNIKLKLKNQNFFQFIKGFFFYVTFYFFNKINNLFGPSPIITFIGPDGVGKSTFSNALSKSCLNSNFYENARIFHHRFELIPSLNSLLMKNKASNLIAKSNLNNSNTVHSFSRTLLYLIYYSIDFILGWGIVLKSKLRNEIIIFDRYYFDFFIQNSYSLLPNFIKKFFYYFIPKPNITFFIYVNPYVAVKRKNELTINEHIEQNKQCLYILRNLAKKRVFINCTGSTDENINYIFNKFMINYIK